MAAGRPVVASLDPNGDAPKLIARARAGYALPPEDSAALAAALTRLAADPDGCRVMGQNGRAFAEEHLSPGGIVKEYEALFAQIIASGSRKVAHESAAH
jgi:colanic acid biosynthesis glycosyl transferase WcaI